MFETFATRGLVPILLRFALAVVFIYHGLDKVRGDNTQWGTRWHSRYIEQLREAAKDRPKDLAGVGDPFPVAVQTAVAWGELLGGIALALGLLTRYAAAGIIVIMIGAIVNIHGIKEFGLSKGGYEYRFVIIMIAACVVLVGGGMFSLDRVLKIK